MTPWERGCGYTQACGSGACGTASLVLSDGFIERNKWLMITMPGGDVFVKQSEAKMLVYNYLDLQKNLLKELFYSLKFSLSLHKLL